MIFDKHKKLEFVTLSRVENDIYHTFKYDDEAISLDSSLSFFAIKHLLLETTCKVYGDTLLYCKASAEAEDKETGEFLGKMTVTYYQDNVFIAVDSTD